MSLITSKRFGGWWLMLLLSVTHLAGQDRDLRLVEAAREGKSLRLLLQEPVDVNLAAVDGATALHWAAHWSDLEAAQLLIDAGARVDPPNAYGVTPLSLACTNRNAAMVEKLLEAGANPNSTQWTGETVLMTCARTGSLTAVKSLLNHGAEPNARENRWEQTPLMWALASGHPAVAGTLLEHGADVQARSKTGFTALMFAAQQGDGDSVRMLLAAGANLNDATDEHGNVLTVASSSGHEALSIFLLEKGADPNTPDSHGVSPLHFAVPQGLSSFDGLKYDDFYRVLPPNMPELARALLAHGADPNPQIKKSNPLGPDAPSTGVGMAGQTPLLLAALAGDIEIIRVLVAAGADPELVAARGTTPLIAAAGADRFRWTGTLRRTLGVPLETVRVLVELGADVNRTNSQGQTAMHSAAFTGKDDIIEFLAGQGAEVDVVDNSGQTPWTMAQGLSPGIATRGRYGIFESTSQLLEKLGAVPRSLDGVPRGDNTTIRR